MIAPRRSPTESPTATGDDPDQQRVARAVDDPGEDVAALLVEAEEGDPATGLDSTTPPTRVQPGWSIPSLSALPGDERREDRHEQEDGDDYEADDRTRVTAEPCARPRSRARSAPPAGSARASLSERRLAHETRILGLMIA